MYEKIFETQEGNYQYVVQPYGEMKEEAVVITGYSGMDSELILPAKIDGLPVRVLQKKTFLSRKRLRKVALPETLEEIGDWTFAYCSALENVWLPRKQVKLGNRIFMECGKLRNLYVYGTGLDYEQLSKGERQFIGDGSCELDGKEAQTAALLAASTALLGAEYLLDLMEAGTEIWLKKWDARMLEIMSEADDEGYTKMILCGEEDYGTNIDEYKKNKRKGKVRLAFLRLLNPIGLKEEDASFLQDYLISHTKGCDSEEAWEVLLKEYGHEKEYFQLFAEIGGISEDNFHEVLKDMKDADAEMKAFLVQYREEEMERKDFFAGLEL